MSSGPLDTSIIPEQLLSTYTSMFGTLDSMRKLEKIKGALYNMSIVNMVINVVILITYAVLAAKYPNKLTHQTIAILSAVLVVPFIIIAMVDLISSAYFYRKKVYYTLENDITSPLLIISLLIIIVWFIVIFVFSNIRMLPY